MQDSKGATKGTAFGSPKCYKRFARTSWHTMGNCCGLCREDKDNSGRALSTEELTARREQRAEAAQRRADQQASKGVKNPDEIRRKQLQQEKIEKEAAKRSSGTGEATLRWQAG
eukprot:Clim_evm25s172 gene=Clim_evmTU25s172